MSGHEIQLGVTLHRGSRQEVDPGLKILSKILFDSPFLSWPQPCFEVGKSDTDLLAGLIGDDELLRRLHFCASRLDDSALDRQGDETAGRGARTNTRRWLLCVRRLPTTGSGLGTCRPTFRCSSCFLRAGSWDRSSLGRDSKWRHASILAAASAATTSSAIRHHGI